MHYHVLRQQVRMRMAIRRNQEKASFLVKYIIGSSVIHLCTVVILFASPVRTQTGFLSIDCGSTKDYTDVATGIHWQTDAKYISTGSNLEDIYVGAAVNQPNSIITNAAKQFASLRYFDDSRNGHERDCYVLPTKPQQQYLIRFTFFLSNWTNSVGMNWDDFDFDIYVNSTLVKTIAEFLVSPLADTELIFSSPGDVINVCLVRNNGRRNKKLAFISTLELRELGSEMYTPVHEPVDGDNVYFLSVGRYDFGGYAYHRYPDDAYDRWWEPVHASEFDETPLYSDVNGSNVLAATRVLAPDLPPIVVMDNAVVSFNSSMLNMKLSLVSEPTFVTLFFQEVDSNATTSNVRGMDILVNDHVVDSLNVSQQVKEVSFLVAASNATETRVTLSQASWSRLRPMVNAMDAYQVKPFNRSQTARNDVDAVSALAARVFERQHLEGDPCLPLPYFWLQCTQDAVEPTIFRVTGLLLDNSNVSGSFPEEILEFKNLSVLSLSRNNLTGSIPDMTELSFLQTLSLRDNDLVGNIQSLSSLVYLQALYLENNSFSGEIPSFLSSFSYLNELHLDSNNFSGNIPEKLLSKIGLNFTHTDNPDLRLSSSPTSKSNTGAIVGGLLGGTAGFLVLISIVWYFFTRKRRATSKILKAIRNAGFSKDAENERESPANTPLTVAGSPRFGSLSVFSLQQVSNATQKFSHKIGEGSFGPVYYGRLPGSGQEIAAKVKSGFSRQGLSEFRNELELLSRIHHGNLVSLAGYCEEADQQVLIYTYFCNGSLRDHLSGKKSRPRLDWKTRLRIAVESATGLEYLHFHCNPRIIHRDVKSANILLDKNMVAKVADFGISKPTLEGMTSGVDTRIMGTPGYIDPEYFISQRLTQKSDVYSFGVVLLEIISGRHPHMAQLEDGAVLSLIEWVKTSVREGNVMDIYDTSMGSKSDYQSARMVLDLALESIDPVTIRRPDMKQVLHRLMQAAQLEEAQNPTIVAPRGDDKIRSSPSISDFEDSPKRLLSDSGYPTQASHVSNDPTFIDAR